jgi:alpha-methylacyl-CoA racemase
MGPLAGVRVLEFAGQGPVPFAGMILGDLGATVTRIDRASGVPQQSPTGTYPVLTERSKRSLALDLKHPDGVDIALRLIDDADVLLDPFRPGVMERLGLGPDLCLERNPRLVFGRLTGFGQTGPLSERAGHDINYIATAGALHEIGPADRPPTTPLNLVGDYGGGSMFLITGVLAALVERGTSGRGQVVDAAMVDGAAVMMTAVFQLREMGLWPGRGQHFIAGGAPWYQTYRTLDDAFISLGAIEPQFYAELLQRLELEPDEWPQYETRLWPQQKALLEDLFLQKPRDAWCEIFEGSDACFSPVLTLDEAVAHPHNRHRGSFVVADGVQQAAPAPRLSRTPGEIQGSPCWPGEHSRSVLADAGFADGEIDRLETAGAVRQLP